MATASQEIDEIRRMMSQIRHELHDDVQGVIEGAEAATDWKNYIRNYPWACVGAVFVLGYLLAPRRRRRKPEAIAAAPAAVATFAGAEARRLTAPRYREEEPAPPKKKGKGIVGTLIGMVAPMAIKAGQGYAMQYLEQWLAQQLAKGGGGGPLAGMAAAFGMAPGQDGGQQPAPGSGSMPGMGPMPGYGPAPGPFPPGYSGMPSPSMPQGRAPEGRRF